jgi:hypothetical protein
MKTFCGSRGGENSVGGIRCEGLPFSIASVKKVPESGHWSHYLQLLSHFCSFCSVISPSNPSSLLFGAGARWESFPFLWPAAKNAVCAARSYPPHLEDFNIATNPLLLQDVVGLGQPLTDLPFYQ